MPKPKITEASHPVRVFVRPGMVAAFPADTSMDDIKAHIRKLAKRGPKGKPAPVPGIWPCPRWFS